MAKKYPMNGPSMKDQADMVYHWNNPKKAKELSQKHAKPIR
jgi:hypothetical protein